MALRNEKRVATESKPSMRLNKPCSHRFGLKHILAVFVVVAICSGLIGVLKSEREMAANSQFEALCEDYPWYKFKPRVYAFGRQDITERSLKFAEGIDFSASEVSRMVSDDEIRSLIGHEHVECLNLCGTRIGDTGLLRLGESNSLKAVFVKRTAVTRSGIKQFREEFPEIELFGDEDQVGRDRVFCCFFEHF
jgi:hypothetical protein